MTDNANDHISAKEIADRIRARTTWKSYDVRKFSAKDEHNNHVVAYLKYDNNQLIGGAAQLGCATKEGFKKYHIGQEDTLRLRRQITDSRYTQHLPHGSLSSFEFFDYWTDYRHLATNPNYKSPFAEKPGEISIIEHTCKWMAERGETPVNVTAPPATPAPSSSSGRDLSGKAR